MGRFMVPVCVLCGKASKHWHEREWEDTGGLQDICPECSKKYGPFTEYTKQTNRRNKMVAHKNLTFRSSEIAYYGPYNCPYCDVLICCMAKDQGGNSFTYPEGPIYPNTIWNSHICNPEAVFATRVTKAKTFVLKKYPNATANFNEERKHWDVFKNDSTMSSFNSAAYVTQLGTANIWCMTEADAWIVAAESLGFGGEKLVPDAALVNKPVD